MRLRQVQMNFNYSEAFQHQPATAYETLLLDAMHGDPTLFNRADAVEMAWGVIEPLLDIWRATKPIRIRAPMKWEQFARSRAELQPGPAIGAIPDQSYLTAGRAPSLQ